MKKTLALVSFLTLSASSQSHAAVATWNGATNVLWNATNWTGGSGAGGIPAAGDSLVFTGAVNTATSNDLVAATSIAGITFDAAASPFTLAGNSITLGGAVTNDSANLQLISLPMATAAVQVVTTSNAAGEVRISGVVSGAGAFTKAGPGILTLSGVNTNSGLATLNAGTLNLSSAAALGTSIAADGLKINGGTLNNSSGGTLTTSVAKRQTWAGDFTFIGSNDLSFNGGQATVTGTPRTVTVSAGKMSVGALTMVAAGTFIKAGAGTLSQTGGGLNTAPLNIAAGTFQMGDTDFNCSDMSGAGVFEKSTGTAKWFLLTQNGDTTFSGVMRDGPVAGSKVGLRKFGLGQLTLSGAVAHTSSDSFLLENGVIKLTAGSFTVGQAASTRDASIGANASTSTSLLVAGGDFISTGQTFIGKGAVNAYNSLSVSSGSVTSGSWLVVGRNSDRSILNQSGGTINVTANRMTIGAGGSASIGLANFSGGTFNNSAGIFVGENSNGTLNVSGSATVNVGNAQFAGNATSTVGNLNLLGGSLNTGSITKGTSAAVSDYRFNFNGGTLKPTANNATFFADLALTTANVYSGGVVLDDAGFAVTISEPLLAPAGNGVNGVASFTPGAGYRDTPMIIVNRGGADTTGVGATAIANVAGGVVTSITITNPGINYTATPTFTVIGGGATTAATVTGTAPTANVSGGLTKLGSGTLTLAGAHTYTAPTLVSAGTLALSSTGTLASSGITVNGASARLLQTNFTPLTNPVTLTQGSVDGTGQISSVTVGHNTGGTIKNGNGTASPLTVDSLTYNGTGAMTLLIDDSLFAPLATTNFAVNAAGPVAVSVAKVNPVWAVTSYPLLTYTGSFTGGLGQLALGAVPGLSVRQSATLTHDVPNKTINLTVTGDVPVWTGTVNSNWTTTAIGGAKNWTLQTAGTPTEFITGDAVLFNDFADTINNPAALALNIAGASVSTTSTTFDSSSPNDYTVSSAGGFGISGGFLIKNNSGALTLNTANTYAGGTTLNDGNLNLNTTSAIGTGILKIANGTLDNTSGSAKTLTTNNAQAWNGDFTFGGSNSLNLGTGAVTLNANRTVTTNGTGAFGIGGAIGGATFGLTKAGSGTFALSGTTSYTGATNISGGTLLLTGSINGANAANIGQINVGTTSADATLNVSGSTVNATKTSSPSLSVGNASTGQGSLVVSSGSVVNATKELWVGPNAGSFGSMVMSGGTVTSNGWFVVGRDGSGLVNVSGGTLNVPVDNFTIASFGAGYGVATLSGNSITNVSAAAGRLIVGEGGTGILTVSGTAAVNVTGPLGVQIGLNAGGTGIANLNGGVLTTSNVQRGTGISTGTFNFNGGTLKAGAASGTYITGLTNAFVHSGGANIDDNAFAITIPQALLAPTGNGVTAGGLTISGNGYISAPDVRITGGGGSGATAIASIDGSGNLTGITLTNPGVNYTSDPTFTVMGGGAAATGSITGSAVLVPNVSGGLAKSGTGTTTLTGANTYAGATTVAAGTLALSGTGSLATSGVTVNGAGAKFIQASTTALAAPVTVTNGTFDGAGTAGNVTLANSAANVLTNGNGSTTSMTLGNLTFNGAATLNLKPASTAAVITAASLTASGAGPVTVNATSPGWSAGTYNLISYSGAIGGGGFSNFTLGTVTGLSARQAGGATLTNPPGSIALTIVSGNVTWTGGVSGGAWTTAAIASPKNWSFLAAPTDFISTDNVVFDDSATGTTTVDITDAANVSPTSTTFANNSLSYTLVSPSGKGIAAGSVVKNGTGTVVIANGGLNTYAGATTLNNGVLSLSTVANGGLASDLGASTNAATNLVFGGGTLRFTPAAAQTMDRNFTINSGSSGTFNITDATTGNLTISGASAATSGGLVKTGPGKLTLTGANLHTGGTTVNGGTLESTVIGLNGGALQIASGATATFTGNNQVSTSTVTGSGAILNNTANTIIFSGDHTAFSGSVTHSAGSNNTQFGTAVSTSQNATYALTAGEFIFAGVGDYTLKMGSLSSTAGTIRGGNSAVGTTTLEVGNLGTNTSIAGNLNNGGAKIVALTKVGLGTLTLDGTNNYSGATSVNAGTLKVNGILSAATGVVTVASTATLGGNGNIGGSVTLNSGGHHALAVGATAGAQVTRTITGSLTLTVGNILDLTAAAPPADGTYTLVTATGGITGTPTTINYNGITGSVAVVANSLVLTVGGSGYDLWKTTFGAGFNGTNNGLTQDPDNDGITNLMEYVLNGNPLTSSLAILPMLDASGANFVFTFHRRNESKDDTTQTFQYNGDLSTTWTGIAIPATATGTPVNIAPNTPTSGIDEVTVTVVKGANTTLFGRLEVVK